MKTREDIRFPYFARESHGLHASHEDAVDVLTTAARLVLYDADRPGKIRNRIIDRAKGGWMVHERHFAVYLPPWEESVDQDWMFTPARLVHRDRGPGYGAEDQFALALPDRDVTLAWNGMSDKVLHYLTDQPHTSRTYLTEHAIIRLAGLMTSPMFVNYEPSTGDHEQHMPAPFAWAHSCYPIGTIEEATAAYSGIALFIARATEL